MAAPLRSAITFLDGRSRRPVDALGGAEVHVSSRALGWPGVVAEAGWNDAWEVDDLTVAHHYLALNVDPTPLTFEVKGARGFRRVTLDPGAAWVCPAGEPFTHRVADASSYALVAIAPDRLDRSLQRPDADGGVALRRTYDVRVPQIEHVVKALVVEADRGNPGGLAFVDALTTALAVQLERAAGVAPQAPPPRRGGLAPAVRRRVLDRMAASVEAGVGVAVEALAREAGLSAAHFARAFTRSVGRAPHQHLLTLRLERARRLLEAPGATLSGVALQAGFADQAHLTRRFKQAFGATPGRLLRRRRAGGAEEP
jgi:AraC family transcriptional regulator